MCVCVCVLGEGLMVRSGPRRFASSEVCIIRVLSELNYYALRLSIYIMFVCFSPVDTDAMTVFRFLFLFFVLIIADFLHSSVPCPPPPPPPPQRSASSFLL